MMPVKKLYEAFLMLIESDEWDAWEDINIELDLQALALSAIPWFKFPRCSLEWDENAEYFLDEKISNNEIQILALYMKSNWLERIIDSWENLKPLYSERDFSPSKMLNELRLRKDSADQKAEKLETIYYRSINGKPYPYSRLAGNQHV